MTKSIKQAILESRHYLSGEFFQASDIKSVLGSSGRKVALNSVQQALVDLKQDGLLGSEPRKDSSSYSRYYRTAPKPDFQPLRMSWRKRSDIPSHSPVWC